MAKIKSVKGRQVFDSRGNPTVEAEIILDDGSSATAISPSGASTGAFEAHELRDKDQNKFLGKSVNTAVQNINSKISNKLKNLELDQQENIDRILLELDGSENKTNLGANATLAVSLAYAKCAAIASKQSLYKNLGKSYSLPIPLMNIKTNSFNISSPITLCKAPCVPPKPPTPKSRVVSMSNVSIRMSSSEGLQIYSTSSRPEFASRICGLLNRNVDGLPVFGGFTFVALTKLKSVK